MAYAFYRTVTCGLATSADQSNFPLLVKFDASNVGTTFKSAANGGHIQNSVAQSGGNAVTMPADLIFTSDSAGSTKIPWEVEYWDATNGVLWAWVKIGTLSHTTATVVYVFYDDVGVTAQQNTSSFSPSNVWNANYVAVYHLPDGTTLNTNDSTSNANNGSITATVSAAAGQIDGGASVATTGYITASHIAALDSTRITVSAWVKAAALGGNRNVVDRDDFSANRAYQFRLAGTTLNFIPFVGGSAVSLSGVATVANNTWHHIVGTYDGTTAKQYVDGVLDASSASSGNLSSATGIGVRLLMSFNTGSGQQLVGTVDEARQMSVAMDANWIATEYANQNAPLTFNAIGAETSSGTLITCHAAASPFATSSLAKIRLAAIFEGFSLESRDALAQQECLESLAIKYTPTQAETIAKAVVDAAVFSGFSSNAFSDAGGRMESLPTSSGDSPSTLEAAAALKRDAASPVESTTLTNFVTSDANLPLEFGATQAAHGQSMSENAALAKLDRSAPFSWPTTGIVDSRGPAEWTRSVVADGSVNNESPAKAASDIGLLSETPATPKIDYASLSGVVATQLTRSQPLAETAAAVTLDRNAPLDSGATQLARGQSLAEAGSAVSADRVGLLESQASQMARVQPWSETAASMVLDRYTATDSNQSVAADATVRAETLGGVASDPAARSESVGNAAADAQARADVAASMIVRSQPLPEFTSAAASDRGGLAESQAAQLTRVQPWAEHVASQVLDRTAPIESSPTVAGDALGRSEAMENIASDQTARSETAGSAVVDALVRTESLASLVARSQPQVEIVSAASADRNARSESQALQLTRNQSASETAAAVTLDRVPQMDATQTASADTPVRSETLWGIAADTPARQEVPGGIPGEQSVRSESSAQYQTHAPAPVATQTSLMQVVIRVVSETLWGIASTIRNWFEWRGDRIIPTERTFRVMPQNRMFPVDAPRLAAKWSAAIDLDFGFDWSGELEPSEHILTSAWIAPGLGVHDMSVDGTGKKTTSYATGAIVGQTYTLTNQITTDAQPANADGRSVTIVIYPATAWQFSTKWRGLSSLDFCMDWSHWLAPGEHIGMSSWTAPGLTLYGQTTDISQKKGITWVWGGTPGQSYWLTNQITTDATPPRADSRTVLLVTLLPAAGVSASGEVGVGDVGAGDGA